MLKPQQTVEVGLGYGFSTIFLMMASQRSGGGYHIAIDPRQQTSFHGIGAARVALLQMEDVFTLLIIGDRVALDSSRGAAGTSDLYRWRTLLR
jgi:hypothetical protein